MNVLRVNCDRDRSVGSINIKYDVSFLVQLWRKKACTARQRPPNDRSEFSEAEIGTRRDGVVLAAQTQRFDLFGAEQHRHSTLFDKPKDSWLVQHTKFRDSIRQIKEHKDVLRKDRNLY